MHRMWFVLVYWIHGNRCFSCVDCDSVTQLITHTVENHINAAYMAKLKKENSIFVSHMMLHTGEKPYQCSQCNKTFTHNVSLLSHLRTHTGEKPFKCNQCDKTFRGSNKLLIHMRIHSGEKSYQCKNCEIFFYIFSSDILVLIFLNFGIFRILNVTELGEEHILE